MVGILFFDTRIHKCVCKFYDYARVRKKFRALCVMTLKPYVRLVSTDRRYRSPFVSAFGLKSRVTLLPRTRFHYVTVEFAFNFKHL